MSLQASNGFRSGLLGALHTMAEGQEGGRFPPIKLQETQKLGLSTLRFTLWPKSKGRRNLK
jgi:hypothetical protein